MTFPIGNPSRGGNATGKNGTDLSFAKKMQDAEDSEILDTAMDAKRRQKLRLDDDDDNISVSQNTSKLPSIMQERKSGMSITGNHFGKRFIDLEDRLNSPPSSTLKYHEFELVPRKRDSHTYGVRPNPHFSTLYNPTYRANNNSYLTDG